MAPQITLDRVVGSLCNPQTILRVGLEVSPLMSTLVLPPKQGELTKVSC